MASRLLTHLLVFNVLSSQGTHVTSSHIPLYTTPSPPGVTLSDGSTIPGDLIIDASGRGSKAADWIAAAGYTAPELQVVNCETKYTTGVYELDPEFLAKEAPVVSWWAMEMYPSTRTAIWMPIEGGKRWTVRSYLGALKSASRAI